MRQNMTEYLLSLTEAHSLAPIRSKGDIEIMIMIKHRKIQEISVGTSFIFSRSVANLEMAWNVVFIWKINLSRDMIVSFGFKRNMGNNIVMMCNPPVLRNSFTIFQGKIAVSVPRLPKGPHL
mmetsp:Transcript_4504/g.10614  ORF Transcript_4504/g.10614 Transcript_4504/m.10614 type:complete len:122 (+) Transcript_4504:110-475(+)